MSEVTPTIETSNSPFQNSTALGQPQRFLINIVGAVGIAHLLNDTIQSMLSAIYPLLKTQFSLSFTEIGWIALVYQITASLIQPWIGLYTDKYPKPYLLPIGMSVTVLGVGVLTFANHFHILLVAAALIGVGSSTFHPEASKIARLASGGKFGMAQSIFQVGGNAGAALGALLAAILILPHGQGAIGWFIPVAAIAVIVLLRITSWRLKFNFAQPLPVAKQASIQLNRNQRVLALFTIALLIFAKFIYIGAFHNYLTFYLVERFEISIQSSQLYLFAFLAAVALGTFSGGPLGDRIGSKAVVWLSFIGVIPLALILPHVNLTWTSILVIMIGFIMSSAFPALVVYAQEVLPGRVGMVSGLMFGLTFGVSGIGAASLGHLADIHGIIWVYQICAFLPLLGLATALLPNLSRAITYKK